MMFFIFCFVGWVWEVGLAFFSEDMFVSDEIRHIQKREIRLQKAIKDYLGVTAKVRLVEPKSLRRYEGKAGRITDSRGK